MNRSLYLLGLVLLSFVFVSCGDDEDEIDYAWKALNENAYDAISRNQGYNELKSASQNGSVYWRESDVLTNDTLISLKTTSRGTPEYTDSVSVRYEGWFYQTDGTKYTFDTTEKDYNKTPREFAVNGVVDGWSTVLQDMVEGEEREVVIPWKLGYGSSGSSSIPGYTTLYFNVKLIKILPMTGRTN